MLLLLLDDESATAQPPFRFRLPDSGLLVGGNYPSGINADCSGAIILQQSCSHGLDATQADDSDGKAGFSYTKLSASGEALPASASVWSCVRDNLTGFVWEVKTDDGGVQDKDNTYFWGGIGAEGRGVASVHGEYYDDWNTLVTSLNEQALCGFSDWRIPHIKELSTLVDRGKSIGPTIDTDYFPNTMSHYYWSSTPGHPESGDDIGRARRIGFQDGVDRSWYRSGTFSHYHVRLMRTDDYQAYIATEVP
ncbi:hypothetical protein GCM10008090_10890 [Arenicella chitinivorans]|uniref:Lcl C-terminal domain-containing protein n=2 Tax=Arenicella chitinivorans TaxID=1329800 RepID=A0A918RPJ8_9GAMM|nr:hypothetical protein GCM10008090_10890 [Arenicella chitinivorans]